MNRGGEPAKIALGLLKLTVPFEQLNGFRYQITATATRGGQPQLLEARHRVHARVEGFIRCGKDTGLARWPSA